MNHMASIISLSAAIVLAGCSAPAPAADPATLAQLWSTSTTTSVSEVDPADSLDELVSRSTLIVRGTVAAVEAGPIDVYEMPDQTDTKTSSLITVDVSSVVRGAAPGDTVVVWVSDALAAVPAERAALQGEALWFLRPSELDGVFHTSTRAGVIGPSDRGRLEALRDPGLSSAVVPSAVRDLSGLEQAVRSKS